MLLIFINFIYYSLCKKDCGYNQRIICMDYVCRECFCIFGNTNENYVASKYCGDSKRPICYDYEEFKLECFPPDNLDE